MSAATTPRTSQHEAERCLFYPYGDCARPATHEHRHKDRPNWVPVCEKHAQMASELYGGQTRPLEGHRG